MLFIINKMNMFWDAYKIFAVVPLCLAVPSPSAVSGIKLDAQPLTIATAAILYHRFFKETDSAGYDSYVSYYFII